MENPEFPSRDEVTRALSIAAVFIVRSRRYREGNGQPELLGAFTWNELDETVNVLMRCLGVPANAAINAEIRRR